MKSFDEWWLKNRKQRCWYDSDKIVWKAALEWAMSVYGGNMDWDIIEKELED